MLRLARCVVLIGGAILALTADAYAQRGESGGYQRNLADCIASGRDRDRCVTYSYCIQSQTRRDRTAADQLRDRLDPENPEFVAWAARTKRYCVDQAGFPPENPPAKVTANDPANTLLVLTTAGLIKIALLPSEAPKHVERLKDSVRSKYYDGRDFTFQGIERGSISIPDDSSGKTPDIAKEVPGTTLDRGDVAMLGGSEFFISRGYNQNSNYTVVGRVADGQHVLDSLKAPDTRPPVFGYPPNQYFEPDQVLAVRIEGDAAASDIATLEKEKAVRIAARAKKDDEHARQYRTEIARLTQTINSVSGNWISVSKSADGHDLTSTWSIKKETDGMSPAKRTLYSAVSVVVTMPSEPGQPVRSFQLQGAIERENLTVSGVHLLHLGSSAVLCRINWKLQAKSPTEFDGAWTLDRPGSRAGCLNALPQKELTGTAHLQKG